MESMVDPGAAFLFESVEHDVTSKPFEGCWSGKCEQVVDEHGIGAKAPHTDEEWQEVRRRAVQLVEAPNLLIMPGRRAAQPGEKSENPQVELDPGQIQELLDSNRS